MVFHWSLSNSKSHHISKTLLSILADLKNAVVWTVSTRPLISWSSSPYTNYYYQLLLLLLFRSHLCSLVYYLIYVYKQDGENSSWILIFPRCYLQMTKTHMNQWMNEWIWTTHTYPFIKRHNTSSHKTYKLSVNLISSHSCILLSEINDRTYVISFREMS